MRILVLQHIACEPPGVFEDVLVERGHELVRVELDEGEALPDGHWDAIVAMGGPMSVNDEDEHPWLVAEKALIADHVRAGRPFWGSCLGAQLLAAALGARVYAGPAPEVGVLAIDLTEAGKDDPVTGALPVSTDTLQWHGDTFDLPEGGVLLASSPAYAHQAYRVGPVAYAVQFHVEVTEAMGEEWATVPAYAEYADRVLGPGGSDQLLVEFRAGSPRMQLHARAMFERWCDLAEGWKLSQDERGV
jgi:GMP synthase-like glutamine amidotransferase